MFYCVHVRVVCERERTRVNKTIFEMYFLHFFFFSDWNPCNMIFVKLLWKLLLLSLCQTDPVCDHKLIFPQRAEKRKMRLRHDYTCIRVWVKKHFFNQSSFVTCMAARYVYCSVVDIAHHILCVLLSSRSHCVLFREHVNKTLYCFHCLILFRLCTISVSIWQEIKLPIPSIT